MKKQTALQWLIGYYYDNEGAIGIKQLEQAEQMEKEQIEDAYQAGQDNVDYTACFVDENGLENYYEQTYGGQDENQS
jgi:hypothetical protein